MVSMYSGSITPMGMNNNQGSINVHQNLKARYGVGYPDFGSRPYAQPYPMAVVPREEEPSMSWFARFFRKCFMT